MTTPSAELLEAMALTHRVTQFYTEEARLLDARRYLEWLTLLAPDIHYTMPVRHNYLGDERARNTDDYHRPEDEFSPVDEAPFRSDNLQSLTLRAQHALSPMAWSHNPPERTRRLIGNVEIIADGPEPEVASNFLLSFSRHGADNHLYTGRRLDTLRKEGDTFRLVRRRVLLDWNVIPVPTLGLFF